MAGGAVGEDPRVPSRALVTAWALNALHADTPARGLVTLQRLNASGIAVTGSALQVGIPPEELLALAAGAASEAGHALALPCELITSWPEGMGSIAAAWATPSPAGQLPGIGCTAVTVLPNHIRKTQALAGGFITLAVRAVTVLLHSAQVIADTLSTGLLEGISIVPESAELALLPFRMVQALDAPPTLLVTGLRVSRVDVVVTLARLTRPPDV